MQAAGPQGPLPASQETISSLERFTFDEKTLGKLPAPHIAHTSREPVQGLSRVYGRLQGRRRGDEDPLWARVPSRLSDSVARDEWLLSGVVSFHPILPADTSRYSLVPQAGEEGAPGAPSQQQPQAGPSGGSPQRSSTEQAPPAHTGVLGGAQGAITSVLNRLFGQAGTTADPPPAPGDIHRPSSSPSASTSNVPQAPASPANPTDDPPEQLIDFDTPVRTTPSATPRRPLPEWAQLARGGMEPGARHTPPPSSDRPPTPPRPSYQSPPLPASSGGSSTFGQGGLVPPTDLFDSDVAQFRATRAAGDIQEIPWNAPNHQHVAVPYVVVGDASEVDDPRLFCHVPRSNTIGDFGLLQLRRVAGRAEAAPVREGRMCCHVVDRGVPGEAAMGRIMRECPGVQEQPVTLSYSGEAPGSISAEDVD